MDDRRRRGVKPGAKPQDVLTRGLPKVDLDTVRPPGSDAAEDAFSAETVVRAVPKELLALKPAKLPAIDVPPEDEPESKPEELTAKAEPSDDIPPVSAPEPSELEAPEPAETKPNESLEDAADQKVEGDEAVEPKARDAAPAGPPPSTSLIVGLGLLALVAALIVYTQC